jgi:hypothetical protein
VRDILCALVEVSYQLRGCEAIIVPTLTRLNSRECQIFGHPGFPRLRTGNFLVAMQSHGHNMLP